MPQESATYTHGHHESVLRSHTWRTAQNSCAYLLPHLKPHMKILDIGCGPGTITADLATFVPQGEVIGLEYAPEVLKQAQSCADERAVKNISFATGDVHDLPYEDGTFDVVHAHQVLQHVGDPVQALREMRRVTKPGGLVAARDSDYTAFTYFPELPGMAEWKETYLRVARANGGEPNAGRQLHSWARKAGYEKDKVASSSSVWCFRSDAEIQWWSGLWADRIVASSFAETATKGGQCTMRDLERVSLAWRAWGKEEDAWFAALHGEIIYTK